MFQNVSCLQGYFIILCISITKDILEDVKIHSVD